MSKPKTALQWSFADLPCSVSRFAHQNLSLHMATTGMDIKLETKVRPVVAEAVRGSFVSRATCGDGACAIHSVFGTVSYSGQY